MTPSTLPPLKQHPCREGADGSDPFPRLKGRGPITEPPSVCRPGPFSCLLYPKSSWAMSKVPSANYDRIVAGLVRLHFVVIRRRGSHIRLERALFGRTLRITGPRPTGPSSDRR